MIKVIVSLILGAAVGAALSYSLPEPGDPAIPIDVSSSSVRDIDDDTNMTSAQAETHRRDRYADLESIEDILALPSDFAETEALYVIAGRADSVELQNLLQQATRLKSRRDRLGALQILLSRLTELDPRSALAIVRRPDFAVDSDELASVVWETWAEVDFDAALAAAENEKPAARRAAARSLYSVIGVVDERAESIGERLDVEPTGPGLTDYVLSLAERSPSEAMAFIESLDSEGDQYRLLDVLATWVDRSAGRSREVFLQKLASPELRAFFSGRLLDKLARSSPEAALDEILSRQPERDDQSAVGTALRQLAESDLESALSYLERIDSPRLIRVAESAVVGQLVLADPRRAVEWARERPPSPGSSALAQVISEIAKERPEVAARELAQIDNRMLRQGALSQTLYTVSHKEPEAAWRFVELTDDPQLRQMALQQVASIWASRDGDDATRWALSLEPEEQRLALRQLGSEFAQTDPARAIDLLNKLPEESAAPLRREMVSLFVMQGATDEAQRLVASTRNTDDYPQLQAALASATVHLDPDKALDLANAIDDAELRDQIHAAVIGREAQSDPRGAAAMLADIDDSAARRNAVMQITSSWYLANPTEAQAWVDGLAAGTDRDAAISAMVMQSALKPADASELIGKIDSDAARGEVALRYVQIHGRTNRAGALAFLEELDISDDEREMLRSALNRMSVIGY